MLLACESSSGTTGPAETASLPQIQVDLPSPPRFKQPDFPEQYPEGSFSIYGLRKDKKQYLGQEVRVKALLLDQYLCPCPGGKTSDTCECDQPHFWLVDTAQTPREKGLMVVDMPWDERTGKMVKLELEAGKVYTVSGTFTMQSNTGFSTSEGLIVYKEHALAP